MKGDCRIQGESSPDGDCLSADQLETLLRYVKDEADEARRTGATRAVVNELIVVLLIRAGLRASELCNLNMGDLLSSRGENTMWIHNATTNVARKVDIDSETTSSLKKFAKLYRPSAGLDDPLFLSERGGRLSYMSLYSKIKIIGQKAGVGRLHPQMLRHTYLVRLYDVTQDLRLVQIQAGHAHSATTARYSRESRQKPRGEFCAGDVTAKTGKQSVSPSRAEARASKTPASTSSGSDNVIVTCEACGRSVSAKVVGKIDSGQFLCPDCLKELRSKRMSGAHEVEGKSLHGWVNHVERAEAIGEETKRSLQQN